LFQGGRSGASASVSRVSKLGIASYCIAAWQNLKQPSDRAGEADFGAVVRNTVSCLL